MNVDRVENEKKRESPADTVDDGLLADGVELVDDIAEKKEMDNGPDVECPRGRRDVGFLAISVAWASDIVNVRPGEEDVCDDVYDFENDTI
jgi:hypothetical protein